MIKFLFTLILLGMSTLALSSEWRLLEVDYFDMRFQKFGANRDPLTPDIPQDRYTGRLATDFGLRILEVGYWNNTVHTEGTESQLQTVGWHYELGIRLHSQVSIFHEHHSRHRMDTEVTDLDGDGKRDRFPVEDSYGIRLNFYTNPNPRQGLFK